MTNINLIGNRSNQFTLNVWAVNRLRNEDRFPAFLRNAFRSLCPGLRSK